MATETRVYSCSSAWSAFTVPVALAASSGSSPISRLPLVTLPLAPSLAGTARLAELFSPLFAAGIAA
jgi:hypothetical protein